MAGACRSLWHWLGGDLASGPQYRSGSQDAQDQADIQAMSAILTAEHVPGDESSRQAAGYGLAHLAASHSRHAAAAVSSPCSICGIDAWIFYIDTVQHGDLRDIYCTDQVQSLLDALTHPRHEGPRRVAVSALAAAGDTAVPGLVALLQRTRLSSDERELRTLTYAADALGEAATSSQHWLPALSALGDKMRALDAAASSSGRMPVRTLSPFPSTFPTQTHFPSHCPYKPTGQVSGNGKAAYNPARSVVAAVEHIAQRAVAAADAAACRAASASSVQCIYNVVHVCMFVHVCVCVCVCVCTLIYGIDAYILLRTFMVIRAGRMLLSALDGSSAGGAAGAVHSPYNMYV